MRIASFLLIPLAFTFALTVATPARAQSAPTSPCLLCCMLGLFCCTGTPPPVVSEAFPWLSRLLPGAGNVLPSEVKTEATPPRHQDVRAMAF